MQGRYQQLESAVVESQGRQNIKTTSSKLQEWNSVVEFIKQNLHEIPFDLGEIFGVQADQKQLNNAELVLKIKILQEELETQREMNKKILKQMRQMEYALLEQERLRAKEKRDVKDG